MVSISRVGARNNNCDYIPPLCPKSSLLSIKPVVLAFNLMYNRNMKSTSKKGYRKTPHMCPVCGKYQFSDKFSFDICPYCRWEDDGLQEEEPDYEGGANILSLNQAKKKYLESLNKKK